MDSYICNDCGCPYSYYSNVEHASRKSCKVSKSGYHYFNNKYIVYLKSFFKFIYQKIVALFQK